MSTEWKRMFDKMIGVYLDKFRAMNRKFEFRSDDLTRQDIRLFEFIQTDNQTDECSMRSFIDHFEIDNPSKATRLIDRLVKKGFIERKPSKTDRRKIILELTSLSIELIQNWRKDILSYFEKAFGKLTVEELENLIAILHKLEVDP